MWSWSNKNSASPSEPKKALTSPESKKAAPVDQSASNPAFKDSKEPNTFPVQKPSGPMARSSGKSRVESAWDKVEASDRPFMGGDRSSSPVIVGQDGEEIRKSWKKENDGQASKKGKKKAVEWKEENDVRKYGSSGSGGADAKKG